MTVQRGAGGLETAFIAEAGSGGPVVAILGEYDALPGIGHGCGHNLMGTAAIGAFLALRDTLDGVRGRVRVIGCPAEESGNGKVHLMNGGAFEGVDAALMYHPGDRDEIDPLMLAMVNLDVELLGKAAHAAAEPQDGVNALALCSVGMRCRRSVCSFAAIRGSTGSSPTVERPRTSFPIARPRG